MRIEQILQAVDNPSAGPTYSVSRLADELLRQGNDASLLTMGNPPANWPYAAPLRIHDGWLVRKTGLSAAFLRDIRTLSREPCILHGHGVWRLANLFPLLVKPGSPARIVCSPRGMLSAWSLQYKAHVKKPFWHLFQKRALDRCHCFHATAPVELEDIRRLGFRTPVTVIPNGVDMPALPKETQRGKSIVFLSRIDPKKGLDILLPAWTSIAHEFSDWNLVIAGPLTGAYPESVKTLARKLNAPRVTFPGQVLGTDKLNLLSGASLFVLPTYSENFGIAVAEALAHGTPVITTTETPWTDVAGRSCGWCVNPDEDSLREALRAALNTSLPELHQMGQRGREWMDRDYSWKHIAEQMSQTYEWLLTGGQHPDYIATA